MNRPGRLVILALICQILGLTGGGKLLLRLKNNHLELISIDYGLQERVEKWVETMLKTAIEPSVEEQVGGDKWMGRDYVEHKPGLR